MTDLIDSLDITTKKALAEYLREFVMEERNERLLRTYSRYGLSRKIRRPSFHARNACEGFRESAR